MLRNLLFTSALAFVLLGKSAWAAPTSTDGGEVSSMTGADSSQQAPSNSGVDSSDSDKEKGKKLKVIPLPVYATDPNEGATYGLMPVFLIIDQGSQHTDSIFAPSASWNKIIGETGTFRWFNYPAPFKSLTFTASISSHVNWGGVVVWENEDPKVSEYTETAFFRWQRSIFFRFFGIGPDTDEGAESSHTRVRGDLWYRRGLNVAPYTNIGLKFEARKRRRPSADRAWLSFVSLRISGSSRDGRGRFT